MSLFVSLSQQKKILLSNRSINIRILYSNDDLFRSFKPGKSFDFTRYRSSNDCCCCLNTVAGDVAVTAGEHTHVSISLFPQPFDRELPFAGCCCYVWRYTAFRTRSRRRRCCCCCCRQRFSLCVIKLKL